MNDKHTAVDKLKEFVQQKIEAAKATSPGEGWEEYYRGRLSAFEEIEAVINSLGLQ